LGATNPPENAIKKANAGSAFKILSTMAKRNHRWMYAIYGNLNHILNDACGKWSLSCPDMKAKMNKIDKDWKLIVNGLPKEAEGKWTHCSGFWI
jgi:hypothetical protein